MKKYTKQIILYTWLWISAAMFWASFQDDFGFFSSLGLRAPLFIFTSYIIELVLRK